MKDRFGNPIQIGDQVAFLHRPLYGRTTELIFGQVAGMTGGEASPGIGSEWNELMYRVHAEQPESKPNWGTFDTIETNITSGDGQYIWCQETLSWHGVYRGSSYGLDTWATDTSSISNSNYGWRPVLELVDMLNIP